MNQELSEILTPYEGRRGSLIPVLQAVQERLGYLPEEAVLQISRFLGTPESEVYGVLTFYAQFRTSPVGRNRITVCRGTACHVQGGDRLLDEVARRLGIREGETSPDMEYGLETVACLGCCALAPTMVINSEVHGQMTTKKVAELLSEIKDEGQG
jgi:NADH-quinone oxidoreductase subunit E